MSSNYLKSLNNIIATEMSRIYKLFFFKFKYFIFIINIISEHILIMYKNLILKRKERKHITIF